MLLIKHRINSIEQLIATPPEYGVELDLRYEGSKIIINHEPFATGELFEKYLEFYHHQLIILNVKSEGIEAETLRLLKKFNIRNYFFLDLSLPYLVKYMKLGERKIAVRFSEFEPIEFVLKFKDKLEWIWVDCFTELPLDSDSYKVLKQYFKICLVSPELQGHPVEKITGFKKIIRNFTIDAVCTKRPELW